MNLIASIYAGRGLLHYQIYKDNDKYYNKSIFDENTDCFEEIDEETVAAACTPWAELNNKGFCERWGNRYVHVVEFFYYDCCFTQLYGFGNTEDEARKQCEDRLNYFQDFDDETCNQSTD